ncbi:hypothetical protein [Sphingomonas turrisvirgatae]|uniref:Uncharacterized protein n=1 Tax=Sphingomonas turrisvirgatae TaxID=1888892 RepID=A0A1E3LZW7_9SPHN|nr:hypothetical protein [Sphingomonas turrisvirgatae]ODP39279.1 hypothetical protein BFL28_10725 [Sphingomonas turrisvirgatae]
MSGHCTECGEAICRCPDRHDAMMTGQTVHCRHANFFATPSVPVDGWARALLGMQIGAGFGLGLCLVAIFIIAMTTLSSVIWS